MELQIDLILRYLQIIYFINIIKSYFRPVLFVIYYVKLNHVHYAQARLQEFGECMIPRIY